MKDLLLLHDCWFGKLRLHEITNISHPFVSFEGPELYGDQLEIFQDLGWIVIDVAGDGNCGYYALLLGLENLGNTDYHPSPKTFLPAKPMSKNPIGNSVWPAFAKRSENIPRHF